MTTYKQAIANIRKAGLPSAKKFRRRTRLEQSASEKLLQERMFQHAVRRLARLEEACSQLLKEEHWAVQGDNVQWVGESDPIEIIRKAREVE